MAATIAQGFVDGRGEATEGKDTAGAEEVIAADAPGASAYVSPEG
jgi:hypothetical protein